MISLAKAAISRSRAAAFRPGGLAGKTRSKSTTVVPDMNELRRQLDTTKSESMVRFEKLIEQSSRRFDTLMEQNAKLSSDTSTRMDKMSAETSSRMDKMLALVTEQNANISSLVTEQNANISNRMDKMLALVIGFHCCWRRLLGPRDGPQDWNRKFPPQGTVGPQD